MGSLPNSTSSEIRWNTTLLSSLSDDMFRRLAPAVVVLVAVMAVGAIGNIIVCYFFMMKLRPSSQNYLLLSLGAFDLASCCVGIPSEIYDIRHYYMYQSVVGCKTMRFLTTLPSLASILVLLVIAADRYRKICRPLHHQIHRCHVRISLVIIAVIATLLSIPALFVYGHRILPTPIPGEFGYDCSINELQRSQQYHVMYESMFCALFFVCIVTLVLIYVKIWRETKRHLKYMKSHAMFGPSLLNEKNNTSSGTYEENIPDSRRNSETTSANSVGLHHCYTCVQWKSRRKGMPRPEALVTPVITLTCHEFVRSGDAASESCCDSLPRNDNIRGDAVSSQMLELRVINKQTDISKTNLPGCLLNTNNATECGHLEETVVVEGDEHMYDPGDDRCLILSDNNQREKPHESCLYSSETDCETRNIDHQNRLSSHSNQSKRTSKSYSYSLQTNHESQNEEDPNLLFSHCNQRKETPESCLYSLHTNNESQKLEDGNLMFSHYNQHEGTPGSSSYPLEIGHESNAAEGSVNSEPDAGSQSTPAVTADINQPRDPEFCNVFLNVSSLDANGNCNNNYHVDRRSLSEPLKQLDISDCGYSECHSRDSDNQKPLQTDEITQAVTSTEQVCPTHTDDNLRESMHCLDQCAITQRTNLSRSSSYSSQSSIWNDSIQLDVFQSKRVSFSTDLDDCESSQPVMNDLEIPESNHLNQLQRSRSEQSLLSAKRSRKALRSTRTTILAFAITVGFIISYLPYLTLAILRSVIADFEHQFDDVSLNVYNIFLRSYFVNNVLNIFVYSCMHLEFRTQLSHLWRRLTRSAPDGFTTDA